ncbi:TPA: DUF2528 family protein [Escherichia coli]|nr:DUF2528 family protein [Escherichia coli]HAV9454996.1 DUF2528 family protein [Escherichia coli]
MSNIKKYIIDYDWKASIEIEIDHDVMTEEKLHQINNFWSDSEYRLNKHGSVLNAVLIMLAQHALLIAISSDLNAYGVVCEFDWNDGNGQEGWPPMDGNDETMQEINTLLIALDKTWDDDLLPLCSQIFRRDIRASSELTQAEAVKALGFLKQKATEQKVAA